MIEGICKSFDQCWKGSGMESSLSLKQIQGAVFGLAVADALGARWEGIPADMIQSMGPADAIVAHAEGFELIYTDDTQMMISVAQTLSELGEIQTDFLAGKFAANYQGGRGYGIGARQVIDAIAGQEDWQAVATGLFDGTGSMGNGAAMRVSPIGLLFADNLELISQQARLSSLPTHTHSIGVDGARLIAAATGLAARSQNQDFQRNLFLQQLCDISETEEFQHQLQLAIAMQPFTSLQAFGNTLRADQSVVTSIICFADAPNDYEQAIGRAIGQGGDVDTLAAMTGTLSGARLGIDAIPERLIGCLEDNHQGRTYLWKLSDDLWDRYQKDRL